MFGVRKTRALVWASASQATTQVAVLAIAGLGTLVSGCGGTGANVDTGRHLSLPQAGKALAILDDARAALGLPALHLRPPPVSAPGEPRFSLARVREGAVIDVFDRPGGERIARFRDITDFGSARALRIVEIRGDWFGVQSGELANGELGWIRDDRLKLRPFETFYWITADLSDRTVELRYGYKVLKTIRVTVGSQTSPTPPGDYAVTDALAGRTLGPYYGCCILALTGHQPSLPANWIGGDRIAIHGTPSGVGGADSAGCLRASDADLISLMARVPLGAPVFIRG